MKKLVVLLLLSWPVGAQTLSESWQLQRLIERSEQQILMLKEQLQYAKRDVKLLDKTNHLLQQLTMGIDQSIEKYQGTPVYQMALSELQAKGKAMGVYATIEKIPDDEGDVNDFQRQSVLANRSAMEQQHKTQRALLAAQQAFVPKIQAQIELGNWQANTRMSMQLTELLSILRAMREDLQHQGAESDTSRSLKVLLSGAEIQAHRQKMRRSNE